MKTLGYRKNLKFRENNASHEKISSTTLFAHGVKITHKEL